MLSFNKYQGAGNDFILIDDRRLSFPVREVSRLCDRKRGAGADGLILLQPEHAMRIFNCDGNEVESCGNGLRCFARFAADLGIELKTVRIGGKTVSIDYRGDLIGVDMGPPADLKLHIPTDRGVVHFVNTGVPHVVQFVENLDQIDLSEQGPYLRRHRLFQPHGANANFAALQPDGSICARTYERGVEAETLSCGTGACAVACIARKLYSLPGVIPIDFAGGRLEISLEADRIYLLGPAAKVYSGIFFFQN